MTPVLKPGMDPDLIDTGVPGLVVTKIEAGSPWVKVWFNTLPPGHEGTASHANYPWRYSPDGTGDHAGNELPKLTLRVPEVDWSKPIRATDPDLRSQDLWVASTEFLRRPGEEPCVAIGSTGGSWAFRTHDNRPLPGDAWAHVVIENVPQPIDRFAIVAEVKRLMARRDLSDDAGYTVIEALEKL